MKVAALLDYAQVGLWLFD